MHMIIFMHLLFEIIAVFLNDIFSVINFDCFLFHEIVIGDKVFSSFLTCQV